LRVTVETASAADRGGEDRHRKETKGGTIKGDMPRTTQYYKRRQQSDVE
jgi:hypothetical protein